MSAGNLAAHRGSARRADDFVNHNAHVRKRRPEFANEWLHPVAPGLLVRDQGNVLPIRRDRLVQ